MKNLLLLCIIISFLGFTSCNDKSMWSDPTTHAVSVDMNISNAGTISPSADSIYDKGEEIALEATANEGYLFSHWSGDIDSTADNPLTLTVDQDYSLTAVFEQAKPKFVLAENGVTVICTDALIGESGEVNGVTYTKRIKSVITPSNAPTTCTSGITNLGGLFKDKGNFNGDISHWDVSSVTAMNHLFNGASSFNGDLSSWDVSNVETMALMFKGATSFNGDISDWDVSSVTNFNSMFFGASAFNKDIGNWETGQVPDGGKMGAMFFQAATFDQDLSGWCVENISEEPGGFAGDSTPLTEEHKPDWGSSCQ